MSSTRSTRLLIQLSHNGKKIVTKEFDTFPVVFGRSTECHLQLSNFGFISRTHGSISIDQGQICVTDLQSSNGTKYRGQKQNVFFMGDQDSFQVEELTFNLQLIKSTKNESVGGLSLETVIPKEAPSVQKEAAPQRNVPMPQKVSSSVVKEEGVSKPLKPSPQRSPIGQNPKFENDSDPRGYRVPTTPVEEIQLLQKKEFSWGSPFDWQKIERTLTPYNDVMNLRLEELCLQGILLWKGDVYDVRNFSVGDRIRLGPNQTEPLYVPVMNGEVDFGVFLERGANIIVPKQYRWAIFREGQFVPHDYLLQTQYSRDMGSHYLSLVSLNEVMTIEMGYDLVFELRYVPIPRPLIKKNWIENRDEFKKAAIVSLCVHLALSVLALVVAPKQQAPQVKDVPTRIAKLLVEPPQQTFAYETPPPPPPPPPPEPEKVPEPEPEKVAEPVKPVEKKIVEKKPAPPPKPVVRKENIQAMQKAAAKQQQQAQAAPSPADIEAQKMAALFGSLPAASPAGGGSQKAEGIKINRGAGAASKQGIRVSGIQQSGGGLNDLGTQGFGLGAAAGKAGYAQTQGSATGKRAVAAGVVGRPSFKGIDRTQGLSNDAVMAVVNKYLADIHRCYERALFNDPNISGRVEYEWNISPKGGVSSVIVKRSEVSNGDFLNSCVIGVFRKMQFPVAKNGQDTIANIGFPFGKN